MITESGFDFASFYIGLDIQNGEPSKVVELNNRSFPSDDYSCMKFGKVSAAKNLGETLAQDYYQAKVEIKRRVKAS